jgi:hypothetical protein
MLVTNYDDGCKIAKLLKKKIASGSYLKLFNEPNNHRANTMYKAPIAAADRGI